MFYDNGTEVITMNRIKHLRTIAGIKQIDLASRLNVRQGTISNWESGKTEPDIESLQRLADIFGTTVDYVLGGGTTSDHKPLTSDEEQLLSAYRAMSEQKKQELISYAGYILTK